MKEVRSGRESSELFPLYPPIDLVPGGIFQPDLRAQPYVAYLPFDWVQVTNDSGYQVQLYLNNRLTMVIFGRQSRIISARSFESLRIVNPSATITIANEDIEVMVQKKGVEETGGF